MQMKFAHEVVSNEGRSPSNYSDVEQGVAPLFLLAFFGYLLLFFADALTDSKDRCLVTSKSLRAGDRMGDALPAKLPRTHGGAWYHAH